ncbi:MAG TPA: hypothetical protein VF456_21560 [Vicinamibacterales bacterium]
MRTFLRRFPWFGVAYGLVLWVFALIASGMGEGTYHLFVWFGAPLAVVPIAGLFAPPIWWGMTEVVVRRQWRGAAVAMLLAHCAVAGFDYRYGITEYGYDQWRYYERAARFFGTEMRIGIALYLFGLAVTAILTLRLLESKPRRPVQRTKYL